MRRFRPRAEDESSEEEPVSRPGESHRHSREKSARTKPPKLISARREKGTVLGDDIEDRFFYGTPRMGDADGKWPRRC